MRMLRPAINPELLPESTSELTLWQHPIHGLPDQLFRIPCQQVSRGDLAQAAWIASVPAVQLVGGLLAGEPHLLRIHNDHMIAGIKERCVNRFVLPGQHRGYATGKPAKNLTIGVHYA